MRSRPQTVAVVASFAAFVLLVAAFYGNLLAYRSAIGAAARQDLEARAEVAAHFLEAPLKTLDFACIRRFGGECRARGYELSIRSGSGGRVFDTRQDASGGGWLSSGAPCGESRVELSRPRAEIFAPYRRALRLFALAVLLGASGMFVVFFTLYRQRVRIRELKRIERFRREFVADVSHEIKTPLTGILGAVDLLGGGEEEKAEGEGERRRMLLEVIRKEARRLNGLVQAILDLARLEREGDVLKRADCDVVAIVREAVETQRPAAAAAGVDLSFGSSAPSLVASVDAQLLGEAVTNLVVNALRHSHSPDVSVAVSSDVRLVRVAVEDHGVGIPAEERERVFERFRRLDPSRATETGGAGLGLAIVRRIARLHGGDVSLESSSPRGCRFVLSVKRER